MGSWFPISLSDLFGSMAFLSCFDLCHNSAWLGRASSAQSFCGAAPACTYWPLFCLGSFLPSSSSFLPTFGAFRHRKGFGAELPSFWFSGTDPCWAAKRSVEGSTKDSTEVLSLFGFLSRGWQLGYASVTSAKANMPLPWELILVIGWNCSCCGGKDASVATVILGFGVVQTSGAGSTPYRSSTPAITSQCILDACASAAGYATVPCLHPMLRPSISYLQPPCTPPSLRKGSGAGACI